MMLLTTGRSRAGWQPGKYTTNTRANGRAETDTNGRRRTYLEREKN
jgi:hypothetical protein